jgi:peptidoglycan/xylan/chitin deacetylase (PgdA/CDA1 family)
VQVWRGDPSRAAVAFSFDAGSDAGHTEAVLDLLRRNGIRATFSLTGDWVRDNPGLAREVAAAHDVINHSDTHRSFTGFSTGTRALTHDERVQEVVQADRTIRAVTGVSPAPWFRPPYGDTDASVDRDLAAAGYRYDVLWTVDSLGWKGTAATAVVDRCLARAENGAIFLFHVGSASTDIDALDAIIAGLRARGYAIGTVASVL